MNLTGNRSHALITHNKLAWTERTNQHTIEEELMVNVLIFHLHCYNHHSSLITHHSFSFSFSLCGLYLGEAR